MSDRAYAEIFDNIAGNPLEQIAVLQELAHDLKDLNTIMTDDGLVDMSTDLDISEF
jgi:hypothetical protein